jgi:hypothetical protein
MQSSVRGVEPTTLDRQLEEQRAQGRDERARLVEGVAAMGVRGHGRVMVAARLC